MKQQINKTSGQLFTRMPLDPSSIEASVIENRNRSNKFDKYLKLANVTIPLLCIQNVPKPGGKYY